MGYSSEIMLKGSIKTFSSDDLIVGNYKTNRRFAPVLTTILDSGLRYSKAEIVWGSITDTPLAGGQKQRASMDESWLERMYKDEGRWSQPDDPIFCD